MERVIEVCSWCNQLARYVATNMNADPDLFIHREDEVIDWSKMRKFACEMHKQDLNDWAMMDWYKANQL